jgi:hypothetical protein
LLAIREKAPLSGGDTLSNDRTRDPFHELCVR